MSFLSRTWRCLWPALTSFLSLCPETAPFRSYPQTPCAATRPLKTPHPRSAWLLRVLSADHHRPHVLSVGSPRPQVLLLARIGSPRPLDSLPLVLTMACFWTSLRPDSIPHYALTLDLTTLWFWFYVLTFFHSIPDTASHFVLTLISLHPDLVYSNSRFGPHCGPNSLPHLDVTLIHTQPCLWSAIGPNSKIAVEICHTIPT